MPIDVTCDACGARFKAPDAAAGKRGKCKKCGAVITVPVPEPIGAPAAEDDMYDIAEPAPAPAKPYKPAASSGTVAPAPPYTPPPPTAASAAMMARGVVPKSANAGTWKNSNNPPVIMKVLGLVAGVILILLGLLFIAAPIMAMMSDKTGKTIRFKGVFFGVAMIGTGVTAILKAFGKAGG
jgi:hypothetical protein